MPQVSFAADIKPLFRDMDISHMKSFGVDLDDYTYMSNRPSWHSSFNGRRRGTSHKPRSWAHRTE